MEENSKKCRKCGIEKELNDFNKKGDNKHRAECKICYNSDWRYRIMSSMTSRECKRIRTTGQERQSVYRDKRINIKFLESLKKEQNGLCYWLNTPMDFSFKDKLRKPSLDRLDNSKVYEVGNVVLTTVFANTGRRDATTKEMKDFINNYLQK